MIEESIHHGGPERLHALRREVDRIGEIIVGDQMDEVQDSTPSRSQTSRIRFR